MITLKQNEPGYLAVAAFYATILLFMAFMLLTSCGSSKDDGEAAQIDPIQGTWTTECLDGAMMKAVNLKGKQNLSMAFFIDNSDCREPTFTLNLTIAYSISGDKIDYTLLGASVTVLSEGFAEAFNEDGTWGITSWKVNAKNDITSLSDDDMPTFTLGEKTYQIFKIDSEGKLRFGETVGVAGDTELTRPTTIREDIAFTKEK